MPEERYIDHRRVYVSKTAGRLRGAAHFIGRFFSRRNVAHAFRTVTGGFRGYAAFFAALFVVQLVFWSGMAFADMRLATAKKEAYDAADCHVIVDGISDSEKSAIENGRLWVAQHLEPSERMYESYTFEKYYADGVKYEMRILLDSDSRSRADDFISYYSVSGAETHTYYTERITLVEAAAAQTAAGKRAFFLISLLLSGAALMILFNIRTNHFKFRYGIYMAFGADFEKLFETAAWELFMIAALTFIPAMAAGVGLTALLCLPRGAAFAASWTGLPLAFLWNFGVVLIATALPVLVLSKKAPVTLLTAEDNSNLVSSLRRSAYIFGKRFPETYELYGIFRFRRYFAGLLLGAVAFSTVFLGGVFLRDREVHKDAVPSAQFGISVPEGIDEVDLDLAGTVAGVDHLMWDNSVSAAAWQNHVVLTAAEAGSRSYVSTTAQDGESIATNVFRYSALDERLIETVTGHGLWKIEGDLGSVLSDDRTVAVSNYILNKKALNIGVGDKLRLAVFRSSNAGIDTTVTDPRIVLTNQILYGNFDYIDVTVGAVVDTGEAEDSFMIGVSPAIYAAVTGSEPQTQLVRVYLEDGLDRNGVRAVFRELRRRFAYYGKYDIYDYQSDVYGTVEKMTSLTDIMPVPAIAALLLSPLVWFFSQSVFFSKREGEFLMLQSFGATDKKIKKLHLFSGGAVALAAFAASVVLCALTGYLMFMLLDNWLPKYGFISAVRYDFGLPLAACAVCLIVSAACGFASSLVPYSAYIKKREKTVRSQLGE